MPAMKNKAAASQSIDPIVTMDRRREDRRDRTSAPADASNDTASPRRKAQRRRHIDPTTCEREYSDQEVEFMRAMDDYKRKSGRMFPTCSEVLEVIRSLGYIQEVTQAVVEDETVTA